MPGVRFRSRAQEDRTSYEIAVPLRLIGRLRPGGQGGLILDLSFPVPDSGVDMPEPPEPGANTFAYRVRYGSDSLIPIYFIELDPQRRTR